MTRMHIAGAQMGAIQKADSRAQVVARMLDLMNEAGSKGADMIVYPELALTTFFPRWYMTDPAEVDSWFETEMPNAATVPLFERARELNMAMTFGYAEKTPEGLHYNSSILTNRKGEVVGKYRKIHLPGHSEYDDERAFQHLEKRYFLPGDLGFNVWRNEGAIGYNTPSVNSQMSAEGLEKRLFHSDLSLQAGAYQNATYVVGVAKAGVEDGHPLMGGSIIVDPDGFVLARAETEEDELIIAECDFAKCAFGKATIFDFARHRRVEHYGRITSQTGAIIEV
jgi:N-carbamoyl-D-amino-acid hydrolase